MSIAIPTSAYEQDPAFIARRAALRVEYGVAGGKLVVDATAIMRAMGFTPDPWQERLLRSQSRNILLNLHRQAGKSTVMAALAVYEAVAYSDALILLLSPALRQSQELFKKCLTAYHAIGRPVPADAENRLTLELSNGSRIVSLPGREDTVRGYSGVRLLIIDEASRVPDDLYKAVRPMLAVSGGRLIAPSTPFGKRGFWFEAWQSEAEDWERYEQKATECARITPEFLQQERAALGDLWYSQEYENEFIDAAGSVFRFEDIANLFTPDVPELFNGSMTVVAEAMLDESVEVLA